MMTRPWRVGVLTNTSSLDDVAAAVADLSSVWGGMYMPLLDSNASIPELKRLGWLYDVDCLYADTVDGAIGELLRKPGWSWGGRGEYGPFGEEVTFRNGLLPARAFISPSTDLFLPQWNVDGPSALALSAIWGVADRLDLNVSAGGAGVSPRWGAFEQIASWMPGSRTLIGALAAGSMYVSPNPRHYLDEYSGVYVIRPDNPQDVVEFWNMRSSGVALVGIPADGGDALVDILMSSIGRATSPVGDGDGTRLRVWGIEHASEQVAAALESRSRAMGWPISSEPQGDWPRFHFEGVRTPFARSFRSDFRPEGRWIDVETRMVPADESLDRFSLGIVAIEVDLHSVSGQDPRFTAVLPPFRRHAVLLQNVSAVDGVRRARVNSVGAVLGVDAYRDQVRVPLAFGVDAIRLLFDDDSLTAVQSDVGKFQTRAAEKFGGPFSGMLTQPGIRAVIMQAASKQDGMTLPHLRQVVEQERGGFPDTRFGKAQSPKEYAAQAVNSLLYNGIFVAMLRVHCSHCRVERYVSADDLATTMTCEFCGSTFSLALSHSLSLPEWRYRLAAHLRTDRVQALLPALSATSLLAQLRHVEEPPMTHVLGLEVTVDGETVEADVAVFVPDRDWTLVLGEVKSANRVDANDVDNLAGLQRRLASRSVRSVLLFATLKEQFSREEVAVLRRLAEGASAVRLPNGNVVPCLPLVLTGPDMSQPWWSDRHPWRWDHKSFSGIFGTAISSCEKNLGLERTRYVPEPDGPTFLCDWSAVSS